MIVDFDARYTDTFMRTQNVTLTEMQADDTGRTSAHIRLDDGPWPGVLFHDLYPSWDDYGALVIELENPESTALDLNLRVDDEAHRFGGNQRYSDRFNLQFELPPGKKTLRIPLADIAEGPADRKMDLSSIDGMVIFAIRKNAGRTFVIHGIRLE